MKAIYFALLSIVIVSCQKTGKLDIQAAREATVDSMKVVLEKQRVIDSMQFEMARVEAARIEETKIETKREVIVVNQQAPRLTTTATSTTTKKKGWSNTAKGAVIGAGVGAATGAIISKKKAEGAIIGGLAGAGVGAGTGAIIDGKKNN